jgi:hypothetical protein
MNAKQRFVAALERRTPDRVPVTTHFVMDYFLQTTMGGISSQAFYDVFGLDPILYTAPHLPAARPEYTFDPLQGTPGMFESKRVASDAWRIYVEDAGENSRSGQAFSTKRYRFVTPKGELSMILGSDPFTSWVIEPLIKQKADIDLIGEYVTTPVCDVQAVNQAADEFGDRGMLRGHICCFDVFGQPGVWQDATCLVGVEPLIMATYDDPAWVHSLLGILCERKKGFVRSLKGAKYDTCGGMMPFLERIAAMQPDAMETFTPDGMGGDVNGLRLAEAKRRIGDRVCIIGGFDQFHFFTGCTPGETRLEVRRCFEAAGAGGGYILSPSDNFFEAEPALMAAFADEAHRCVYD